MLPPGPQRHQRRWRPTAVARAQRPQLAPNGRARAASPSPPARWRPLHSHGRAGPAYPAQARLSPTQPTAAQYRQPSGKGPWAAIFSFTRKLGVLGNRRQLPQQLRSPPAPAACPSLPRAAQSCRKAAAFLFPPLSGYVGVASALPGAANHSCPTNNSLR